MDVEIGREIRGYFWKTGKYFNPGVIPLGDSRKVKLLSRCIYDAAEDGLPDAGKIKTLDLDEKGRLLKERTVWRPGDQGIDSLEDLRCTVVSPEGLVGVCLTAVRDNIAYPGVATLPKWGDGLRQLPPVRVLSELGPGKNTMILDPKRPEIIAFRPEGCDRKMQVVYVAERAPAKVIGEIEIKGGESWASYRAGFAAPPQYVRENGPTTIDMHGMTCENGFYKYSLGEGILQGSIERGCFEIQLSEQAICNSSLLQNCKQLHPEVRDAIYCVGSVGERRAVSFGDTETRWVSWSSN